jgi:alpha-glucosidase (family GH31 glycosyl hydrolase)
MYPEVTPLIRDIIRRRYEMIPFLYSLALESHMTATPPQRWVGWGYESDHEVWANKILTDGETQYWLGNALIIGGVYESNLSTAKVYLPKSSSEPHLQFLDLNHAQTYYNAGQWIEVDSKWQDSIPVLAKVGSVIPIGRPVQTLAVGETSNPANLPLDDYRAIEIFPPQGPSNNQEYTNTWYEDDGVSPPPAQISVFTVKYSADEKSVKVEFREELQKNFTPAWSELAIILPAGDNRNVVFNGKKVDLLKIDDKERRHFLGMIGRGSGKEAVFERSKI